MSSWVFCQSLTQVLELNVFVCIQLVCWSTFPLQCNSTHSLTMLTARQITLAGCLYEATVFWCSLCAQGGNFKPMPVECEEWPLRRSHALSVSSLVWRCREQSQLNVRGDHNLLNFIRGKIPPGASNTLKYWPDYLQWRLMIELPWIRQ